MALAGCADVGDLELTVVSKAALLEQTHPFGPEGTRIDVRVHFDERFMLVYEASCEPRADCDLLAAFPIRGHVQVAPVFDPRTYVQIIEQCDSCEEHCRCRCASLPWHQRDSVVVDLTVSDVGSLGPLELPDSATSQQTFCDTPSARRLLN